MTFQHRHCHTSDLSSKLFNLRNNDGVYDNDPNAISTSTVSKRFRRI